MKHKHFTYALAMLMSIVTSVATAHDFEVDGIYYNITSSSPLTVEVTYKGSDSYSFLDEYKGNVTIPETVTYNAKTYSVTSIGNGALSECYVASVTIPNSVTSIGDNSFYHCYGLTSINIPNGVTSIGARAFSSCYGLTSVTIPNSVTSIGDAVFSDCTGLESVTIPNSVTSIGSSAFFGCSGLTSVTIGNSVTSIGDYAFGNCSGLTKAEFASVESLCRIEFGVYDSNPLCYAHHLYINGEEVTNLIIPNSVTEIGNQVFRGCSSLTSITIPNSVTDIDDYAFEGCSDLTSVTINSNSIASKTYSYSSTLADIFGSQVNSYIFGSQVKSIGDYACYKCSNLTSVTIGNSVTEIGRSAFAYCSGLTKAEFASIESLCNIKFGDDCANPLCYAHHLFIDGDEVTDATIPNSVIEIGDYTFYNCSGLTSVTIPNSVTSIGSSAFSGCSGLTSVTIPNSVTSIGYYAFYNCSGLTSITIPNGVTYIGDSAFSGTAWYDNQSDGLIYVSKIAYKYKGTMPENTDIILEEGTLAIAGSAFSGCSSLTSITIPNSVTSISEKVFYNCSGLTTVTIPNSVTSIGGSAFSGCSSLTSVKIGNSVTSIGGMAFYRCLGLTSITIPNSVTSIGSEAFFNCIGLNSIIVENGNTKFDSRNGCNAIIETETNTLIVGCNNTVIPESVTSIGRYAFFGCSGLTSITIPNSVTMIGMATFSGCSALTSITIPNSVTSIGERAFSACNSLTSVTIPNSVTSIGYDAFNGCSNLIFVRVDLPTPLSIRSSTFSNRANVTLYVPAGSKAAYEAATYWQDFKEIVEMSPVVNVGSTGFATYCSPVDVNFSGVSGIKAYIASGFNPSTGTLVLTRVTEVPAGEGLYIVGDEGSYNIPATTTDMIYSNLLKGVTTATTISPTDGDNTNFILANGSHGVGFYTLSAAGELAGGKAYLQLPTASVSGVKAINFAFDDGDATGISEVKNASSVKEIYNLQGQRISQPRKGLNIINGKKVIIK